MHLSRLLLPGLLAMAVSAQAADPNDTVTKAVQSLVPNTKVEDIRAAPMPGFREVSVQGQILYVSDDGKYLLQGMVYDIAAKKDLTEMRRADLRRDLMKSMPASERIAFAPKQKKYTVSVFTDIDCGFCRRLHAEMPEYNKRGIEVQYLLFPRGGMGSESHAKAVSVWCASDKAKALTDAKAGVDPAKTECTNPIEKHYNTGIKVGVTGTPALVLEDGTKMDGYVPPDQLLERLDQHFAAAPAAKSPAK